MSQKEEQQKRGEERRLSRVERLRKELEEAETRRVEKLAAKLEANKAELASVTERRDKLNARIEVLTAGIEEAEGESETPAQADANDDLELDVFDAPEVGFVDPTVIRRGA